MSLIRKFKVAIANTCPDKVAKLIRSGIEVRTESNKEVYIITAEYTNVELAKKIGAKTERIIELCDQQTVIKNLARSLSSSKLQSSASLDRIDAYTSTPKIIKSESKK